MKPSGRLLAAVSFLAAGPTQAQDRSPAYPFERFLGEWTLKNDQFEQVWDGETVETLSISGHHTLCSKVNTEMSVLCVVDAVDFQGHILWAVQEDGSTVSHLSQFGISRLGNGAGSLDEDGNLSLSIRFSDEPDGTYRHYTYAWISVDEYRMVSIQYDANGQPTGNWYGGSFVRVEGEPQ